jgi:hypothetical protein
MMRKVLMGAALVAALAVAAFFTWYQLVKAGILRYNKYDRREKGELRVGGDAPDLALTAYDGSPRRLSELWRAQPAFLVFGSCT